MRFGSILLVLTSVCALMVTGCGGGGRQRRPAAPKDVQGDQVQRNRALHDSIGDAPAPADIATIRVSNDNAGLLSFEVNFVGKPNRDTTVLVYLDTDKNAATGAPAHSGADYELVASDMSAYEQTLDLLRWNGTAFDYASDYYPDIELEGGVLTLGLASADKIASSFNFAVETKGKSAATLDRAPESGQPPWSFLMEVKPVQLLVARVKTTPRKPRAGRTFAASIGLKASGHVDLLNSVEDFVCAATVGQKSLEPLDSSGVEGVEGEATGQARCVWRIPPGTSGKLLQGSVEVTFRGRPLSRSFSVRIAR